MRRAGAAVTAIAGGFRREQQATLWFVHGDHGSHIRSFPRKDPVPGASTSTTALSVSISSNGSPFVTRSPLFFPGQELPFSCAISSAGMTTLIA